LLHWTTTKKSYAICQKALLQMTLHGHQRSFRMPETFPEGQYLEHSAYLTYLKCTTHLKYLTVSTVHVFETWLKVM